MPASSHATAARRASRRRCATCLRRPAWRTGGPREGVAAGRDPALSAGYLAAAARTLQVPSELLRVRRAGDSNARRDARGRSRGVARSALQPPEQRRVRPDRGSAALQIAAARGRTLIAHHHVREHLPATDRRRRGDPSLLPRHRRRGMGLLDRPPDRHGPPGDPAADVQAGPLDAGDAAAAAADEGAAEAVQGRQEADEPGADEALPGAPGQPARILSPAPPAAAVLPVAVLPPAERGLPRAGARHRRARPRPGPRPPTPAP